MSAPASAIVRVRNECEALGRAIASLRAQTVPIEVVVVDSGSTDGSLEVAAAESDGLVRLAPKEFTYGRALNAGAEQASGPICFALSAHCVAPDPGWVRRSLDLYSDASVAATNGALRLADGSPLVGTFLQDAAYARAHPLWGFSNHASSFRRSVWMEVRFNESLGAAEDKEWACRVLERGWRIAYRSDLMVPMEHRWRAGARANFTRMRREWVALGDLFDLPPYTVRDLARDWWQELPDDRHSALAHRFANRVRLAGLAGRYVGRRRSWRRRRSG